jgi:c(7)-type cytochrome triheme protein
MIIIPHFNFLQEWLMKRLFAVMVIVLGFAGVAFSAGGVKKKRVAEQEYGNVILDVNSLKAGVNPVLFEHWVHRKAFTCRVCHVDLGFGMKANEGTIRAADNQKGYFCGSCHNGKFVYNNEKLFAACSDNFSKEDMKRCLRCHSQEKSGPERDKRRDQREAAFHKFADNMPRERGGNGINWELAEEKGDIKLIDYIEGLSSKRAQMANQKDFTIGAKVEGVPEIIFSHKKHTVWNGCELCHPDIFIGVKKGMEKYSMIDLFAGKYCGACHGKVAFPQNDCRRCHTKQVQ